MTNNHIATKTVAALVIGNALEWYDFVVYSFMTLYIAKLFFPNVDDTNSLLAATATFGVAFFMRPIGGVFFGIYADKHGRKAAIISIIALMTFSILLISITPTYHQIGFFAPLLIVIMRLIQGFATGGEFATSTTMLIELAPIHERGFYGSWQSVGQIIAMLLGATVGMLVTKWFSDAQIESFAWRIPFLCGLIIAPVGIYLRGHLQETYKIKSSQESTHFIHEIKMRMKQIILAMGLVVGGTVATYINISYIPTYATHHLHLSINGAFIALLIGVFFMVFLIPLFGWLSDRIGRKGILRGSLFIYLITIYPLFWWLCDVPTLFKLMIVEVVSCLLLSAYFGVYATIVAELFPKKIRSTGLAISYNLTVMVFGGFAQFIVTWLIAFMQSPLAITYYLLFAMTISFVASIFYQEKNDI